MIPAPFRYARAESTAHALDLLSEHGTDAKLLAGGQSLLPVLKMRLAHPAVLIDLSRVAELSYVRVDGDHVAVGAATRHCDVVRSQALREQVPLLAHCASLVGDRQIRHRGTLGGSLVHADPAADLPTAVLCLAAVLIVEGPSGRREVAADDFFRGYFETDVREDEVLVEVRLPRTATAGWGYEKFVRRSNDWAIVAVAAAGGRVALANMGDRPLRASSTERALSDGASLADAARVAADDTAPVEDMHADRDFRRHLARVLTERALATATPL